MNDTADVIIIGAGVIGAATAFEMSKQGLRTLSVDKNPVAGYGSTSASCAIVRVHYSTLEGTAFAYEGYYHWRDWADYLKLDTNQPLAEFRQTGCLTMRTQQNGYLNAHIGFCDDLDIPYELWEGPVITKRLPIYDLTSHWPPRRMDDDEFGKPGNGNIDGAVFWPTAGYVTDPQFATQNLTMAAQSKGARFLFNKRVVEILQQADRACGVRLDDGQTLSAPVVVNIAGPHSSVINSLAGVSGDMAISTRALRQEVVHVPAPEGFDFEADGTVVSDSDIGCYARPEKGNHILIGSEDPECDPKEWVDADDYDHEFTDQWTHQAYRYAQRVPSLGIPSRKQGVVDLYDVTEDWIPIYDKSSLPGYYMAIGTSGNQFKNAAIAGKLMAQLVEYNENGNDHDQTPMQLALPYISRSIDVGFYSRNRQINAASSFSVLG
jgi:sarcosine oxidase subunit beta